MADFDKINIDSASYNVKDTQAREGLAAEISARKQADKQLQNNIDDEKTARENGDAGLLQQISKVSNNVFTNNNTVINAVLAGMPTSGDISGFLNTLQTENPGKAIFVPYGTYTTTGTINITAPQFTFNGVVNSTAPVVFNSSANEQRVYIYSIVGNGSNTGVQFMGVQNGRGRNTWTVDYINNCSVGILFTDSTTSGGGVLRNKLYFNYIENCATGIALRATQSGSFVNQNFFGGGGIACTTAISMAGNQTDPFNGNVFDNISFEESTTAVNIENARNNVFRDFRLFENTAINSIVCAGNTYYNHFIGAMSEIWSQNMVSDMGVNFYDFVALDYDNEATSLSFVSRGETIFPTLDKYLGSTTQTNSPPTLSNFWLINMNNETIVMPAWNSLEPTQHPYILNCISVGSSNVLMAFNGSIIAYANSASGSSGTQLESGAVYLGFGTTFLVKIGTV